MQKSTLIAFILILSFISIKGNAGYYKKTNKPSTAYHHAGTYRWPDYYVYYGGAAYSIYPYHSSYAYTYPSYSTQFVYPSYPYEGTYYRNDAILTPPPNVQGTGIFYRN